MNSMGQYLSFGIAKSIIIDKEGYPKEKVLKKIEKSIDLNIFKQPEETEKYLILDLKEDIMEKYAIKFIEEQLEIAEENTEEKISNNNCIKELENKKYAELMEIAEQKKYLNFQFLEGCIVTNDVSYLTDGLTAFADIIIYLSDGKIIMECYNAIFRYIRNQIIKNSANPIKTAMVVSITG